MCLKPGISECVLSLSYERYFAEKYLEQASTDQASDTETTGHPMDKTETADGTNDRTGCIACELGQRCPQFLKGV